MSPRILHWGSLDNHSHGVVPVAKIAEAGDDVAAIWSVTEQRRKGGEDKLLLIQPLVNKGGDNAQPGELGGKVLDALGAGDEVDEQDALLLDAAGLEDLDGHDGRAARGKHGVEEKDPSVGNVFGELVVKELGHGRLLVSLDQDLADADGPAAVPQALLHGLAGTHDRHAADLALEGQTIVGATDGGRHGAGHCGEVVEALLDEEADDAVRVEDEVPSVRIFVTDDAGGMLALPVNLIRGDMEPDIRQEGDELRGLGEDGNGLTVYIGRDSRRRLLAGRAVVGANGTRGSDLQPILLCRHFG